MNKQLLIFLVMMGLIIAGLIYYHYNREQVVYSNVFFGAVPSAPALPAGNTLIVNVHPAATQAPPVGQQTEITPGTE